jgi:hypothetical protein
MSETKTPKEIRELRAAKARGVGDDKALLVRCLERVRECSYANTL